MQRVFYLKKQYWDVRLYEFDMIADCTGPWSRFTGEMAGIDVSIWHTKAENHLLIFIQRIATEMWSYNDIRIKPLMEKIDTFKTADPGTTKLPFSKEEMEARAFIIGYMEAIGLTVTTDSIENICGRLPGANPSIAPVWTGSHIDTVLEAGMFDGIAGVVAGLEAARFQMGCIGSRTNKLSVIFGLF